MYRNGFTKTYLNPLIVSQLAYYVATYYYLDTYTK